MVLKCKAGILLQMAWSFTHLWLALTYEFTDWKNSQCAYGEAATNGIYCDRSGASVILAPEDTANAGFAYDTVLSNSWVFDANLNVDYSSEYFITTNLDKNIKESGYSKVGLVLGLTSADGKWRVSLIGDNLTDERIKLLVELFHLQEYL
jgi:hypothetical protein